MLTGMWLAAAVAPLGAVFAFTLIRANARRAPDAARAPEAPAAVVGA